jgi:hypothetical protein
MLQQEIVNKLFAFTNPGRIKLITRKRECCTVYFLMYIKYYQT